MLLYFRTGDITVLQVDAIVNSTNETMDDNSPMCQRIFTRAGPGLKKEIYNEVKGGYIKNLSFYVQDLQCTGDVLLLNSIPVHWLDVRTLSKVNFILSIN
jgi:hypothetical protein